MSVSDEDAHHQLPLINKTTNHDQAAIVLLVHFLSRGHHWSIKLSKIWHITIVNPHSGYNLSAINKALLRDTKGRLFCNERAWSEVDHNPCTFFPSLSFPLQTLLTIPPCPLHHHSLYSPDPNLTMPCQMHAASSICVDPLPDACLPPPFAPCLPHLPCDASLFLLCVTTALSHCPQAGTQCNSHLTVHGNACPSSQYRTHSLSPYHRCSASPNLNSHHECP